MTHQVNQIRTDYPSRVRAAMREWVEDVWGPEALDGLTPAEVVLGIEHQFYGGVHQFLEDEFACEGRCECCGALNVLCECFGERP